MTSLSDRIPQAGLQFLLKQILSPRASVDDVMWYVRHLYGDVGVADTEWVLVRDRVARAVVRSRTASDVTQDRAKFRAM